MVHDPGGTVACRRGPGFTRASYPVTVWSDVRVCVERRPRKHWHSPEPLVSSTAAATSVTESAGLK